MSGNSALGRLILSRDLKVDHSCIFGTMKLTDSDLHDCFAAFVDAISSNDNLELTLYDIDEKKGGAKTKSMSQKDLLFARWLLKRLTQVVLEATCEAKIGLGYLSCPEQLPGVCDEVWTLLGCQMPMVLRPVQTGNSARNKVIGPALIPGLMHGEVFDMLENGSDDPAFQDLKLETVELI